MEGLISNQVKLMPDTCVSVFSNICKIVGKKPLRIFLFWCYFLLLIVLHFPFVVILHRHCRVPMYTPIPKNVIHQHQIHLDKACVLSGHLFLAQDPCYGCAHHSGHRIQQKESLTKRSQSSSLLRSLISCCTDNSR